MSANAEAVLEAASVVREEFARVTAERDEARQIAASLGHQAAELQDAVAHLLIVNAEALALLRWAVTPTTSHAVEERVGKDIAEFIREHGPVIT